jgi:hypothetical protein
MHQSNRGFFLVLLVSAPLVSMLLPPPISSGEDLQPERSQSAPKQWGLPSNGFRLALAASKAGFTTNEPISIYLTLTNADEKAHWLTNSGSLADYSFVVENEKGRRLPKNPPSHNHGYIDEDAGWQPSRLRVYLQPHEQTPTTQSDLRPIFDLQTVGKFKVTATRPVPILTSTGEPGANPSFTNLISNTLEISIVEPGRRK